jgi:hypothetical protein
MVQSDVDVTESRLDDDEMSYKSCIMEHEDDTMLFDSADTARFPQGDLPPYVINDPEFKLSWTMMTYGYGRPSANAKNGEGVHYQCQTDTPALINR